MKFSVFSFQWERRKDGHKEAQKAQNNGEELGGKAASNIKLRRLGFVDVLEGELVGFLLQILAKSGGFLAGFVG
ncbi:MAG TPA: hypothetical protein VGH19_09105 [Verrucomicrobiae bacterium]